MNSAAYLQFEQGFLKEARDNGCDIPFLQGLIAEAKDMQEKWSAALAEVEVETGDKLFRQKLANELVDLAFLKNAVAEANGEEPFYSPDNPQVHKILQSLSFGGQVGPTGAGAIGGGGAGGLLGLLLGQLLGNPMLGMMLGGLGGAGLGSLLASGKLKEWFGAKADAIPKVVDQAAQQGDPQAHQVSQAMKDPMAQSGNTPGDNSNLVDSGAIKNPMAGPANYLGTGMETSDLKPKMQPYTSTVKPPTPPVNSLQQVHGMAQNALQPKLPNGPANYLGTGMDTSPKFNMPKPPMPNIGMLAPKMGKLKLAGIINGTAAPSAPSGPSYAQRPPSTPLLPKNAPVAIPSMPMQIGNVPFMSNGQLNNPRIPTPSVPQAPMI